VSGDLFDIRMLSLISVLPLMLLGVWIISNESFATLSSRNEAFIRVIKTEDIGRRAARIRVIGIYFFLLSAATISLYLLIAIWPEQIPAALLLLSLLSLFLALLRKRAGNERRIATEIFERELPSLIQLLTILISSGISPSRALSIIGQRSDSLSAKELDLVVSDIANGTSLTQALDNLSLRYDSLILRRFTTSIALGIERGSSLGPILISQVRDARLSSKNLILQRAGKAEISLMIPIVFLILPISILFALFPSFEQLNNFL
jgi:tight adherence protein C